jgi:hypothetical protein
MNRICQVALLWAAGTGLLRAAEFDFVVIGDTRPRFESENFGEFEKLIPAINGANPALVINLGDLIYGYAPLRKETQWDRYQQVVKKIQSPYYQLPGNHDTHSKDARRVYARRFGKFYESFDYGGCHFVLLNNNEEGRWGYLGQAQFEWLRKDLRQTQAQTVFVFMHFPVWDADRVRPPYYQFWAEKLHPLFKTSRVRAVFGGHYHAYGPSREFDGIRYFITGGGGAELRPEYAKAGGTHHFVTVKVRGEQFDLRVITASGELSDMQADVMGGLMFGDRHASRIGVRRQAEDIRTGVRFPVSLSNPYREVLAGHATWHFDSSFFSVEPARIAIQVPAGGKQIFEFTLKALNPTADLPSLPRLDFDVASGGWHHRFHREVLWLDELRTHFRPRAPVLDGQLSEWEGISPLRLAGAAPAEIRAVHDGENLYLALSVPEPPPAESGAFADDLQVGLAHQQAGSDFGRDVLRLGMLRTGGEAHNRTPGHKVQGAVPGVRSFAQSGQGRTTYELAIPLRLLKGQRPRHELKLVINVAFPSSEDESQEAAAEAPKPNSFAYQVRYGSDSLVPVYFIGLVLDPVSPRSR